MSTTHDSVNHPKHYTSHPSGVECITVTRHMTFNIGNVVKYCWRAGLKTEEGKDQRTKQIEDLKKAQFYLADEIKRLEVQAEAAGQSTSLTAPKAAEVVDPNETTLLLRECFVRHQESDRHEVRWTHKDQIVYGFAADQRLSQKTAVELALLRRGWFHTKTPNWWVHPKKSVAPTSAKEAIALEVSPSAV